MRLQCIPEKLPNNVQERRAERELQNEHRHRYRNSRDDRKKRTGRGQLWRELCTVAVAQRRMANAEPIGSGKNGVSRLR